MDQLLPQMDKAMGALDDLHNMASYIGDLRIIVIVITVTAYLGGIIYFIYKCVTMKAKKKGASPRQKQKYVKADSLTDVERSERQSPDFSRYSAHATPPALVPYSKEEVKAKFMD